MQQADQGEHRPGIITVTLNARLQPEHRVALEDAFNDACQAYNISADVLGGGSRLAPNGEVASCDIEILMDSMDTESIGRTTRLFEAMLAPKGSYITLPDRDAPIAMGRHEGLALYLDDTGLPADVYQSCDTEHVYEECERRLQGIGMLNSHWQGQGETALYMYGNSFTRMHAALRPLLVSYPLCRGSRVERIA